MKTFFALSLLGLLVLGVSAEPAKVSKADKMREKPFIDSKVILALKTGQKVDIQKRQGSWYYITVLNKSGWAPMLSIHRTQPAAVASSGSISKTSTGRTSGGGIVSTTGVRGLNEEQLKTATFSEAAVAAVEKYRTRPDSAAVFASAGALKKQSVPPLKNPAGGAQ